MGAGILRSHYQVCHAIDRVTINNNMLVYKGYSVLEGQCSAEFRSNLPQHTCMEASSIPNVSKSLISCFMCV